ncbi:unnamed protein product [Urochloa decumbens]|uniref:Uncharacterized protein n=1 Tax=Urochloa decumbens TaxID=240449 RepID=A0ABC9BC00_9POAL
MAPAVADAAAVLPPPPGPGPALGRRDLAAVKALMFPSLAGLCVGGASVVHPWGEVPGLIIALFFASFGAILFAGCSPTSSTCCSCAPPYAIQIPYVRYCGKQRLNSTSFRESLARGPSLRSLLRHTAWLSYLAALIFDALSFVGCFVVVVLEIGPRVGRIGTLVIDVGVVVCAGISCIDILPTMALQMWRMKPGGAAADGCVV